MQDYTALIWDCAFNSGTHEVFLLFDLIYAMIISKIFLKLKKILLIIILFSLNSHIKNKIWLGQRHLSSLYSGLFRFMKLQHKKIRI
jgi:hypothetical protein